MSPHLFRLGSSYTSVGTAGIAATSTPFQPPAGNPSLLSTPTVLECDGAMTTIASTVGSTVTLEFATLPPGTGDGLAVNGHWIPAESTVVVAPEDDRAGSLQVACEGNTPLDLSGVYVGEPS